MRDPIDEIERMMKLRGLRRADMMDVFGTRARACEIMTRKRSLTLRMIRTLNSRYRMSAAKLIAEYRLSE